MNAKVKVKKTGRKRRAAGWTLLVLGVVVAGVWVASRWRTVQADVLSARVAVHRGYLLVGQSLTPVGDPPEPPAGDAQPEAVTQYIVELRAYDIRKSRAAAATRLWDPLVTDAPGLALWPSRGGYRGLARIRDFTTILLFWPAPAGLLVVGGGLLIWGVVVRPRAGACGACGYSLAGLSAGAACPECGKAGGTK